MAPTKDYAKYLRASMKAQRAYIRSEQKRMTEARRLYDLYNAAMGAIELHPLSVTEIVDRQKQLEQMGRDIAKTHGDGPGQRAWFKQQCSTTSQDTPAPSVDRPLLWMCHVRGPDEILAAPDYETALKWSDYVNSLNWRGSPPSSFDDCLLKAAPALWPSSAAAHAENLPKSVAEMAMPQPERVSDRTTQNTDAAQETPSGTPIAGGGR